MYRNKKDVDKHVESLISKLSLKEFKTRAYSVARLYFEVGDYASCQKYVEQYLTYKDNAAAHKLLGQAYQKQGLKEKALEEFKTSLDIDPTQTSIVLDICELLTDDEIDIDPGRARYWCEKAEAIFPRHQVTFQLRERLLNIANPDPEALVKLLNAELLVRPRDPLLHARLLKHYLNSNKIKEALEHSCKVEFESKFFSHNYDWYEVVSKVLNHSSHDTKSWLYQLLLLTVKERICLLSLAEIPNGSSKSLIETSDLLFQYDQAIENIAQSGASPGYAEFHSSLLQHHKGQLAFHSATFLLKKAKKDQIGWREAVRLADPLMLIAWQTVPLDMKVNWLNHAPEKQKNAVHRWYIEGSYRCSQSGHYVLANCKDKSQLFLDQISQFCSGPEWKNKLYEKMYTSHEHQAKMKSSYFASNSFHVPTLRLPRRIEVEAYDVDAQRENPNSLHHVVWILLNYKNYANFKCNLFDMLMPTVKNCGPEGLNKIDIHAFAYCAALTAIKQKHNQQSFVAIEKPYIVPANITDLLCTLTQMKWWDCAYKFCQNELGTELTDIRATLSAGIEVVRCIDNHGLDPELLCILGRIFSEQAKLTTNENESNELEMRAFLYYSEAIPLLAQLKNKTMIKFPEKRLFDYTHADLSSKELNALIEESKLYVALVYLNDCEFEKVVDLLSNIKTPKGYYYLGEAYKRMAIEEMPTSRDVAFDSKCISLLSKAKQFAFKALEKLKNSEAFKNNPLYSQIQDLIEDIEACINKIDPDFSCAINNMDGKNSSDENISLIGSEQFPLRSNHHFRNISSTPKHQSQANITSYRTAIDSQLIETNRLDHQCLERIEKQIKNLQKRDITINEFMEQTKNWFKENSKLGNEIINTIHSNTENTTEQFKLLKISVGEVKSQLDECRNECKDVVELKKQVAELKKEVFKLKKVSSDQTINENDLYNVDENYRSNDNTSTFTPHMPFTPTQVIPPFTQRLVPPFPVPPNPYQLYGQNLYSLYNQYAQFAQPQSVPGAPPVFDPTRGQMNYSNVYPTPDQMYLDVAHLVPPNLSAASAVPTAPPLNKPTIPVVSSTSMPTSTSIAPVTSTPSALKSTLTTEVKGTLRSLPVNVVITSSDPLPTCTTTAAPILSVTIPPQHIKGSPHNYQIPMPCTNESKAVTPPKFSFSQAENKQVTSNSSSPWNPTIFTGSKSTNIFNNSLNFDNSKAGFGAVVKESSSPNMSFNKSRTLSEKSNTSVENYDPCPDFKPIIPLPAEVKVTTGEEDEVVIFNARAKLFRFVDKQWKERGLGEMKLLQHKTTGKVRVLMRREQIHKICANHIILPEMELKPMKNETKAYFWVANDFAEETVILEKFCIRFKTADIAKQFFDTFEKARQEASSSVNSNSTEKELESQTTATAKSQTTSNQGNINDDQICKTVVGGFTFSSTPSFKAVADVNKTDTRTPETSKDKVNVFSGLSFKTNAETPFTNLFDTTSKQTVTIIPSVQNSENSNKLNTSDVVEEFEPAVDFKPVVPLPALVDQKTGEEDEDILFEHRAKLLRFDASAKEWKERGLGNIKLLVKKDNNQKIRLLMRREQIMKVCCNHTVTKEMIFQKMPNVDKAVTWCAKDFSDGELVAETFCLRFKTVQLCNEFVEAVKLAQSKIGDDLKAVKEEQNALKQNNLVSSSNEQTGTFSDWSDKFKPKPGCWECKICYIRNEANVEFCCACESPKDPTAKQNSSNESSTFNFVLAPKLTSSQAGWGDKFKPKEGTWECNQCLVRNDSNIILCSACSNPKDPSTVKNESKSSLINNASGPKFNFGISHTANVQNVKNETSLSFNATGLQKFSFGIPASKSANVISFGDQKSISSYFGASKASEDKDQPINFSLKSSEGGKLSEAQKIIACPTSNSNVLKGYGFSFQAPQNDKEQIKDKQDNDNKFVNIDEAKLPNSPFSSLKEMDYFHISGEDNEKLIFGQRANLYKFISGKWEKYAVGIVKLLAHQENGKIRILMRQEDLKICLNHCLTHETKLKPKDEKTWHITINYFNEGKSCLEHFCLKFPNTELALQFKNAVDQATGMQVKCGVDMKESESDDVVFVGEILASNEEKQKAIELKLPENFYTYKNKPPCQGCRGCKDDDETINEASTKNNSTLLEKSKSTQVPTESNISTPIKGSIFNLQSPTISVYGTPGNFDKTAEVSIFRTPLGSVGSNIKSPISSNSKIENNNTNKENKITEKTDVFNTFSEQKLTFGSSNGQTNIFSTQPSTVVKKSILAAPKLDSLNTNMSAETKTIFGENKSIFAGSGISTNKSVFDFTSFKKESPQSSDVKSIFGDDQKPVNLFSGSTQGSIFGPSALKVDSTKFGAFNYFGSQSESSGSNNTIFGKVSNEPVAFSVKSETNSFSQPGTTTVSVSKESMELKADEKEKKTELPLKVDNALSFAALSTSGPGFNIQRKADFEWEGAGQQLFTSKSKAFSEKSNGSNNENTEAGVVADEEYDPHYEPIVPLPDKIVVTTGEEDEEKLFGERCKLFRYDEKSREWKERGVGEIKILYHPSRMTYRLLLRRELVHKAVLNMLLFMDLELLPMKNSDRAWTWAGINYAENVAGEQETLAVRFKTPNLATDFHNKVLECVRKLQAAAAEAIRKDKETSAVEFESVAPLRLPKHLENSARADNVMLAKTEEQVVSTNTTEKKDTLDGVSEANKESTSVETKQVHFEETEEDYTREDDEYEHNYDHNEDYDDNYNEEEEEESGVYFSCEGEAIVQLGSDESTCSHAHIQVVFDQDIYSPKIVVTDSNTGEVLADMLIYTETEFQITGDSCSWSGVDYDSVKKTVTINFPDSETAMYFYDSCETSKAATCSSTDPES